MIPFTMVAYNMNHMIVSSCLGGMKIGYLCASVCLEIRGNDFGVPTSSSSFKSQGSLPYLPAWTKARNRLLLCEVTGYLKCVAAVHGAVSAPSNVFHAKNNV